jgi:plasmid stabilization system protein ParE
MAPEQKEYTVIVSPGANDRAYQHFEFLAQVSVTAADRLLDKLLADIRTLAHGPTACPPYDRPYLQPGKYRYKLSANRYRIVFTIEGDTVFVDDIQDCREDDSKSPLSGDED